MTCRGIAIECCGGCCGGAVGVVMMPPMRLVLPRADLLTANTEKTPAVSETLVKRYADIYF